MSDPSADPAPVVPLTLPQPSLVARRPAETSTLVIGAVVGILARIFHWDGEITAYATILVGALPAGITWLVNTIRNH